MDKIQEAYENMLGKKKKVDKKVDERSDDKDLEKRVKNLETAVGKMATSLAKIIKAVM